MQHNHVNYFIYMMQLKKHLVTASYIDDSLSKLDQSAKDAGVTVLGEMGLDPGIGNSTSNFSFCGVIFNFGFVTSSSIYFNVSSGK